MSALKKLIERLALQSIISQYGHDIVRFLAIDSQNKELWKDNTRALKIDVNC